jgi:hypothetical protein
VPGLTLTRSMLALVIRAPASTLSVTSSLRALTLPRFTPDSEEQLSGFWDGLSRVTALTHLRLPLSSDLVPTSCLLALTGLRSLELGRAADELLVPQLLERLPQLRRLQLELPVLEEADKDVSVLQAQLYQLIVKQTLLTSLVQLTQLTCLKVVGSHAVGLREAMLIVGGQQLPAPDLSGLSTALVELKLPDGMCFVGPSSLPQLTWLAGLHVNGR